MILDASSALGAVGAAQRDVELALERLHAADAATWTGPAAAAYTECRDAAVVTAHAVERELRVAREQLRAFVAECDIWGGVPRGYAG